LFAVTAFRHTCRASGVTEVTIQGNTVRFSPLQLSESGVVRLKRLYPKAVYKSVTSTVSVPKPTQGAAGGRMGAPPLRDEALLDWCGNLVRSLTTEPAPAG